KESGDREAMHRYAGATARLTEDMLSDAKELLDTMGIPWVQAPGEGEAQAAHMTSKGDAYAVMSQDADALLFGTPRLVKNISVTGKRKLPGKNMWVATQPEIIELEKILEAFEITKEQLIITSMLIGTDYNPHGIKGMGPAKALKLVKEEKTLKNVLKKIEWTFDSDPYKVFDLFINPDVTDDYKIKFGAADKDKIRKLLIDKHEFSEERIENTLKKLDDIKKQRQQKSLFGWK
ncbi:MAG: flap structure-specific endonuclease, partial [archaeon]|nr:flap structure-specific endonuclease [archaeon]